MVSLTSSENSSSGAISQSIGIVFLNVVKIYLGFNLGFFLSFNLFLPLSSVEFCNKYIFKENQLVTQLTNFMS